jgi:hypothetical protein
LSAATGGFVGYSLNKRNFTRVDYSVGASIRFDDNVIFGHVHNLSLCGMFIRTDSEVPFDKLVQVTVYNDAVSSFKLYAQAVHRETGGMGFQVSKIDVRSFDSLRNIVEQKCNNQNIVMAETFQMLDRISHSNDHAT